MCLGGGAFWSVLVLCVIGWGGGGAIRCSCHRNWDGMASHVQ